jgi:hypothetical protein
MADPKKRIIAPKRKLPRPKVYQPAGSSKLPEQAPAEKAAMSAAELGVTRKRDAQGNKATKQVVSSPPKSSKNSAPTGGTIEAKGGVYRKSAYMPLDSVTIPAFMAALAATGNITLSCKRLSINRLTVYLLAKRDPEFDKQMREALQIGYDGWEDEAARRAFEGTEQPIYSQGIVVGSTRQYSDRLAEFLLKGAKAEKYNAPTKMQHSLDPDAPQPGGGAPELRNMADEELNRLINQKIVTLGAISHARLASDPLNVTDVKEKVKPRTKVKA